MQHSRADFFDLKRVKRNCSRRLEKNTSRKHCEFETITAAELLASKFLSLIGKSRGDYELRKKIRKSDMSVEAITEVIHEYIYEKLNESPETEEKNDTWKKEN